jgi:hypothetical protein
VIEYAEKHGVAPVGVQFLAVYHDDRCKIHDGGFCDCNPEVGPMLGLDPRRN